MTNSLANTSASSNVGPPRRLNLREQRALSDVVDAARRAPGALRVLAKGDLTYTAQFRNGRTRWTVRDHTKAIVLQGDYA